MSEKGEGREERGEYRQYSADERCLDANACSWKVRRIKVMRAGDAGRKEAVKGGSIGGVMTSLSPASSGGQANRIGPLQGWLVTFWLLGYWLFVTAGAGR